MIAHAKRATRIRNDALKDNILAAMRADAVPAESHGLWVVRKSEHKTRTQVLHCGKLKWEEPCKYTWLGCYTTATLHQGGEAVMHDTPIELRTHLDFALRAHGSVLITGLGLGCVTRGVLANPRVTRVVVIERDKSVLKLVEPYMPRDPRLHIVNFEAVAWCEKTKELFDCAWHDLWTNEDHGEPHLAVVHQKLIIAMRKRVKFQGAWAFPRCIRKACRGFRMI